MIWQPEFTDKTLSRKPGAVQSQQKLVHRDVLPFSLPVTPDGWVMVPKQVTPEISNAINVVGQRCTCGNCSQRLWDLLLDATQQGVNRG
ncbi:hypothetical protein C6A62_20060 [Escherichia coli]|nr:hypothetical protein C6A62_20060 [Escherichia coli]